MCECFAIFQEMPFLQYLAWSPHEDAYAYVYHGNIYYKPGVQSSKVYPLTSDGTDEVFLGPIYNGIPDWVYEGNYITVSMLDLFRLLIDCIFHISHNARKFTILQW